MQPFPKFKFSVTLIFVLANAFNMGKYKIFLFDEELKVKK